MVEKEEKTATAMGICENCKTVLPLVDEKTGQPNFRTIGGGTGWGSVGKCLCKNCQINRSNTRRPGFQGWGQ